MGFQSRRYRICCDCLRDRREGGAFYGGVREVQTARGCVFLRSWREGRISLASLVRWQIAKGGKKGWKGMVFFFLNPEHLRCPTLPLVLAFLSPFLSPGGFVISSCASLDPWIVVGSRVIRATQPASLFPPPTMDNLVSSRLRDASARVDAGIRSRGGVRTLVDSQ